MSKEKPKKKLSNEEARKKFEAYLKAIDAGKRQYIAADKLLNELLAGGLDVGQKVPISGNRAAALVDNFAEKNKHFKTVTVGRYGVDVSFED